MKGVEQGIRRLIVQEKLDDFEQLLTPREWDEVPFFSRSKRIGFLDPADSVTKSRVLVVHALKHLDRVLKYRDEHRPEVFVMISVTNWEDLFSKTEDEGPVIPHFWISTDPTRDLASFRMKPGVSREARMVSDWLDTAGLLADHQVFDGVVTTPDVARVYVARTDDPRIAPVVRRGGVPE
jgi:hypothetical protein